MANEVFNSLLKEYEIKRQKAEFDLEDRKAQLYAKFPRLQQIDDELNHLSISVAKSILLNNNFSSVEIASKSQKLKEEKLAILQNANLPKNYLEPWYECSICQDTGYISNGLSKTKMCSCLKQKLLDASFNDSNMTNLDKENFSTFNENVFSNEVDLAKYHFNISPRENIKNIKKKCIEFVENFDNPDTKNLLFSGNTGLR